MKMHMKQTGLVAAVSTLAFALIANAPAAESAAASGPEKTYTGIVTEVNRDAHTVKAEGTLLLSKKFNLGSSCTYDFLTTPSGSEVGLHPGQKITISYQDVDGVLVADKVKQEAMKFSGWVKTANPATHTITVSPSGFGFSRKFEYDSNCQVTLRGGKDGTFADIQPGNYVALTYETPSGGAKIKEIAQTSAQFKGELTAIDLDAKTIKAKTSFDSMSFNVGDHCVVEINGKTDGHLSDLRPNEGLLFTYDEVNGVNVVNRIEPAKNEEDTASRNTSAKGN